MDKIREENFTIIFVTAKSRIPSLVLLSVGFTKEFSHVNFKTVLPDYMASNKFEISVCW